MTVAQLVNRFKMSVAFDLDPVTGPYPEGGTSEAIDAWTEGVVAFLDEAMVELAEQAYLTADNVALTLEAGVGTYLLSSSSFAQRLIEPFGVDVDGRKLRNAAGNGYGLWSPAELKRDYPRWYDAAPGTPVRAAFFGDRLVLDPPPSAAGVAYVEGKVAPASLSAADLGAVPGLPLRMHPGIVGLAVYMACKDYAQEGSQFSRLTSMRDEAMAIAADVGRQNLMALAGSGTTSYAQTRQQVWM